MSPSALRSSYAFCRDLSRQEAGNFYYSFLLLPLDRRRSMCALYAFLRHTDDLADSPADRDSKRERIVLWRQELDRVLAGDGGSWAGWPALRDTVIRHGLPREHLHAVIDGVLMDVEPRGFTTFDELHTYCYHVASAVGLCCLHIWGYRSGGGRAERLAESCGIALQLTNILRDVREDALNGRVYIPSDELQQFQVSPEELRGPHLNDRLRRLLEFQAQRAKRFYAEARPLIELVEPVGRPVLRCIVGIYRALLDEIIQRDYDVLASRVRLTGLRKTAIAVRSLVC
jgi:phytoene synthase